MTNKGVRIVILCEDKQQEIFARKYLEQRGYSRHKIEPRVCPSGKKAGEQYVREQYSQEVKTLRQRSKENKALVVIIDADSFSVEQRLHQLDNQLSENGERKRAVKERIAIFIPKRNIETWITYAAGNIVNEEISYPKLQQESDCISHVRHLASNICPTGLPSDAPPSLQTACDELRRIL